MIAAAMGIDKNAPDEAAQIEELATLKLAVFKLAQAGGNQITEKEKPFDWSIFIQSAEDLTGNIHWKPFTFRRKHLAAPSAR